MAKRRCDSFAWTNNVHGRRLLVKPSYSRWETEDRAMRMESSGHVLDTLVPDV